MKKSLQTIKNILRIIGYAIIAIIVLGILLYVAMVIDTNPVKREIEATVRGEIPYSEVNDHLKFHAYHFSEEYEKYEIRNIDVKVRREFVLHNWKEGYLWVHSDIRVYDVDGGYIRGGADETVFKIRKIDGQWVIVDSRSALKNFNEVTVPW